MRQVLMAIFFKNILAQKVSYPFTTFWGEACVKNFERSIFWDTLMYMYILLLVLFVLPMILIFLFLADTIIRLTAFEPSQSLPLPHCLNAQAGPSIESQLM